MAKAKIEPSKTEKVTPVSGDCTEIEIQHSDDGIAIIWRLGAESGASFGTTPEGADLIKKAITQASGEEVGIPGLIGGRLSDITIICMPNGKCTIVPPGCEGKTAIVQSADLLRALPEGE